jgi:hypothetical protein
MGPEVILEIQTAQEIKTPLHRPQSQQINRNYFLLLKREQVHFQTTQLKGSQP